MSSLISPSVPIWANGPQGRAAPARATSSRSLRASSGFRSFVLDQLEPLGSIVAKAMFGGVGLYCGGVFFGLIARDVLYLKVDATNRGDYERAGSQPFRPYPDRAGTMRKLCRADRCAQERGRPREVGSQIGGHRTKSLKITG